MKEYQPENVTVQIGNMVTMTRKEYLDRQNDLELAQLRLDILDRIRRVAKSRCLRDSDKLTAIQQILKGY